MPSGRITPFYVTRIAHSASAAAARAPARNSNFGHNFPRQPKILLNNKLSETASRVILGAHAFASERCNSRASAVRNMAATDDDDDDDVRIVGETSAKPPHSHTASARERERRSQQKKRGREESSPGVELVHETSARGAGQAQAPSSSDDPPLFRLLRTRVSARVPFLLSPRTVELHTTRDA